MASTIINARESLVATKSTKTSVPSTIINKKLQSNLDQDNERDDTTSNSSGIVTAEDSDTSTNVSDDGENQDLHSNILRKDNYRRYKSKRFSVSNSQCTMYRITMYLSTADWRIFNYITKNFLQNGMTFLYFIDILFKF